MPKFSPEKQLSNAISNLRSERAELIARISEIDESFSRLGIALSSASVAAPAGKATTGKRRGRPPGSKNSAKKAAAVKSAKATKAAGSAEKPAVKQRKRRKFAVSGDESILSFVQGSTGQPNTPEVNAHWQKEGRAGTADNALSLLVKAGKLKRITVEGERSSRYAIP
jgi:hypothetical protein